MEILKILGLILSVIMILFTLGHVIFSLGEIHQNKSNTPKVLFIWCLKILIYIFLINNLLYGLILTDFESKLNIFLISSFIIYESFFINKILFIINRLMKNKSSLNILLTIEKIIFHGFKYIKYKVYWCLTLCISILLLIINIYNLIFLYKGEHTTFEINNIISFAILLALKITILKHFDMGTKTSIGIKNYFKPTPKKIRIIGDSLLATSIFLTGYSLIMDNKTFGIVVLAIGGLGKFLSNLFTEIEKEK